MKRHFYDGLYLAIKWNWKVFLPINRTSALEGNRNKVKSWKNRSKKSEECFRKSWYSCWVYGWLVWWVNMTWVIFHHAQKSWETYIFLVDLIGSKSSCGFLCNLKRFELSSESYFTCFNGAYILQVCGPVPFIWFDRTQQGCNIPSQVNDCEFAPTTLPPPTTRPPPTTTTTRP